LLGNTRLERRVVIDNFIGRVLRNDLVAASKDEVSGDVSVPPASEEAETVFGPRAHRVLRHFVQRGKGAVCKQKVNIASSGKMSSYSSPDRSTMGSDFGVLANFLPDVESYSLCICPKLVN